MEEIAEKSLRILYKYIREKFSERNYHEVDSDEEFRELYGGQGIYALLTSGLPCLYDANRRIIFIPSMYYLSKSEGSDCSKILVAVAHEVGHHLSYNNCKRTQELINSTTRTLDDREEIEALADEEADRLLKKLGITDKYHEIRERLWRQ